MQLECILYSQQKQNIVYPLKLGDVIIAIHLIHSMIAWAQFLVMHLRMNICQKCLKYNDLFNPVMIIQNLQIHCITTLPLALELGGW
jgi:hypothetical protein